MTVLACVLGGIVVGLIGAFMMLDGDNNVTRIFGLWLVLLAGGLMALSSGAPAIIGWIPAPPADCYHMVKIETVGWTCVDEEEMG